MPITREVMQQRDALAESIAKTIEGYTNNSFCETNDKDHVLRWASQFDENDQLFVLQQTDILLSKQYISKEQYKSLIDRLIRKTKSSSLQNLSFLDIQQNGTSQRDMLLFLEQSSQEIHNVQLRINDYSINKFVYFDDVVFTGDRICRDLEDWIINTAPMECKLLVASLFTHTYASYNIEQRLTNVINDSGKNISLSFSFFGRQYENKFIMRNQSDVFWPREENINIPFGIEPNRFVSTAPQGQNPGRTGFVESYVFRNESDRDRFEKILCEKGFYIISLCSDPAVSMKPLGYKTYRGLGFGGSIFTYRNSPNNTPLVFWWGNPEMEDWNPLSRWYPLMMRVTY
ncbi:TPA: hypothetical protein U5D81_003632 [Yersinia enterocolitica]|uniref:phosphoribosyltransferase-like protein n=1 Tax=Yersinia enterocolitica TaxID=630 RepID=UPI002AC64A74|nr:hypothetical protein [Yersinia enterocolitica]HEN3424658.1 hypothetical protein [Yersinia enterocolitica]